MYRNSVKSCAWDPYTVLSKNMTFHKWSSTFTRCSEIVWEAPGIHIQSGARIYIYSMNGPGHLQNVQKQSGTLFLGSLYGPGHEYVIPLVQVKSSMVRDTGVLCVYGPELNWSVLCLILGHFWIIPGHYKLFHRPFRPFKF
jgi:hypothetical protein